MLSKGAVIKWILKCDDVFISAFINCTVSAHITITTDTGTRQAAEWVSRTSCELITIIRPNWLATLRFTLLIRWSYVFSSPTVSPQIIVTNNIDIISFILRRSLNYIGVNLLDLRIILASHCLASMDASV